MTRGEIENIFTFNYIIIAVTYRHSVTIEIVPVVEVLKCHPLQIVNNPMPLIISHNIVYRP